MELQTHYRTNAAPSQYYMLVPSMIQKTAATPPKLRGKAAEIRGIVPFIEQVAYRYLGDTPVETAAKRAAKELNAMYSCLSGDAPFAADRLANHSRRLASLWVGLERASDAPAWRVKPKLHLMQELCEEQLGCRPALFWTYRDEEFGGSLAALGRRRGGAHSASGVSTSIVLRFIARETVPSLGR